MSASAAPDQIPIKEDDLTHYKKRVTDLLRSASWQSKRDLATMKAETAPKGSEVVFRGRQPLERPVQSFSILELAKNIAKSDEIMEEGVNQGLNLLRQGMCVAFHVADLYSKTAGLESLRERNSKAQLQTPTEQLEFREKTETHAAISIFVFSYYVSCKLAKRSEELSGINLPFNGLPESLALAGQLSSLQCVLYHFSSYLKEGAVVTGLDFLRMAQLYFGAVLQEIKNRVPALKHTEAYTERSYRLVRGDFSISGFHGDLLGARLPVEFKRVDINTIVGNRDAKLHGRRVAQSLIAYDFEAKMNPMVELGGFPWVYLMKGIPGTGKTLLISAVLTLVADYCKELGIPFRPHLFPNAIVSTFQGGSAENMEQWMTPLRNPQELILAPIDDAENSFQDRTMQGVSAGVREVIGVFLRQTEGASAINRGNAMIMFATNIPEQLDRAVLSRVLARMDVDGARTREDFLDQNGMWTKGVGKLRNGFMDLAWPRDYEHLSAQRLRTAAERAAEEVIELRDKKLAAIVEEVSRTHKPTEQDFYAALFVKVQKEFSFFSSRDVRNIQTAVGTRLLDFDFPEEWLSKRDSFVVLPYGKKKEMIIDLMQENLKGVKFHHVFHQETMKYLDTMVSILDATRIRRVEEIVQEMGVREEANAAYMDKVKKKAR